MPPKKKSPCPHLISDTELGDYAGIYIRHRPGGKYGIAFRDPSKPGNHDTPYGPAFTTRDECLALLKATENHREALGIARPRRTKTTWTLAELYEAWVPVASRTRAVSTMSLYDSMWKNHIRPRFGQSHVTSLTPQAMTGFLRDLERRGLSPSVRTKIAAVLRLMLRWGVEQGIVRRGDLPGGIKGVPEDMGKHIGDFLVPAQVKQLLKAVKRTDKWYYPHTLVMAHTGLRIGEMLALRWDADIDLDAGMLHVQHTLRDGELVPPKTKAAIRPICLTPALEAELRRFRKLQEKRGVFKPGGLAMITPTGEAVNDDNYRSRVFRPAVELAGITTRCVPHTLRHSVLSELAAKNTPPTTIMRYAGHKNFRTTAEIYVGTRHESLAEAAAVIAKSMT